MLLLYFCSAALLSFVLTPLVRLLLLRYDVVDRPQSHSRKIHTAPIALGGGIAVFVSFSVLLVLALYVFQDIGTAVPHRHIIGLLLGALVLIIGGSIDDRYTLPPMYQIIFPIIAAGVMLSVGIGPEHITNPFGGTIDIYAWRLTLEGFGTIVWLADLIVFVWLTGMMMTTKLLDGLDGLVTGIVAIGALVIFFLSMQPVWYEPEVALMALIFTGVLSGFLIWNWHPAKIFLGEGGSTMLGFVLGSLAIISGGKIATTLLVMGLPILDIIRVMSIRASRGVSLFRGDSEHLHFKLIHSGLHQTQAVLLFYAISLLFGLTTLFLQSSQKVFALLLLLVLMILLVLWLQRSDATPPRAS